MASDDWGDHHVAKLGGETRAHFARRVARVQDHAKSDDFQAPDGEGLGFAGAVPSPSVRSTGRT